MPRHSAQARIWHALEAARTVERIVDGRSLEDYLGNEVLRLAVERGMSVRYPRAH